MKTAEEEILNQIYLNVKERTTNFPYVEWEELSDEALDEFSGDIEDATNEFRECGEETDIRRSKFSRHYECDEVATILDNGVAVGWTYWHGGGKYGEPEEIDWIDDAYFVDVTYEMRMVNVYKEKV